MSNLEAVVAGLVMTVAGAVAAAGGGAGGAWDAWDAGDAGGHEAAMREIRLADTVVRIWDPPAGDAPAATHYAISLGGGVFSPPRAASYRLHLRHGSFEPRAAAPAPPIEPGFEAAGDTNLYIVQFATQPLEAYRAELRHAGATVHSFLPRQSHVVRMDPDVVDVVAAMPFVRWVGAFHPAYRLETPYLRDAARGDRLFDTRKFNIMVFEPGMTQKEAVAAHIRAIGGSVDRVHAGKRLLEATLTPTQLFRVVRWDEVMFADTWSPGEIDMDLARAIGGADFLETVPGGYDGSGVRGEVLDQGFNLSHVDFASRPLILHTPVDAHFHGASTSGIVFGDGTADPTARGMLPEAQGIVADWDIVSVGRPRYDHTGELVQPPYEAVFQSSSVGSTRTPFYTTISADLDEALFDFDVLHCQSQSNAGDENSRPQAWAKNIVSVGGVRHFETLDRVDDAWGFGASTGPATDGRVKPDLSHFYDSVRTTALGTPDAYTDTFGGTSAATPIVAGHFGLFFEMWSDGLFGNPVDPVGSVFANRAHMTTAKAMLINTAHQYDWTAGGPNGDVTRVRQGWGMPDLRSMYDLRFRFFVVDETDLVANLATNAYTVTVEPDEPALKATLVFADPPGAPFSLEHRVNDLTLRVISPTGTAYWGNHGLHDGLWSAPGGAPNTVDTVENVFVAAPEPGVWTIEVTASEIVEDGHVETPEFDADYALVVSGVREELPPLFVRLAEAVPTLVPAGTAIEVEVEIAPGNEGVIPGSETLYYRAEPGVFAGTPLVHQGGSAYVAVLPAAACGTDPEFYVSAQGDGGTVVTSPVNAPASTYGFDVGTMIVVYAEDFEAEGGWTVENVALQDGAFERAVPAGGGDRGDPPLDADGSGFAFVTDNEDGDSDVDGGPTRLLSPPLDGTTLADPMIGYARWFTNDDRVVDTLDIEISNDDGKTWVLVESVLSTPGWVTKSFRVADYVTPNDRLRLRFSAIDNPNDSITEAGVDAITIHAVVCDAACPQDIDRDGQVGFADVLAILAAWGDTGGAEDIDGDGVVGFGDVLEVLAHWGACV